MCRHLDCNKHEGRMIVKGNEIYPYKLYRVLDCIPLCNILQEHKIALDVFLLMDLFLRLV